MFGCSAALRHTLSPEHGMLTFAAKTELTRHWLIVLSVQLARDWSWDGLAAASVEVRDTSNAVVGSIDVTDSVGPAALDPPDRGTTTLIFFDAFDYKPPAGTYPAPLHLSYPLTPRYAAPPVQSDPSLALATMLPIATPPTQTPVLVSAGIALSPHTPAPDYSATARAGARCGWSSPSRSMTRTISISGACSPTRRTRC